MWKWYVHAQLLSNRTAPLTTNESYIKPMDNHNANLLMMQWSLESRPSHRIILQWQHFKFISEDYSKTKSLFRDQIKVRVYKHKCSKEGLYPPWWTVGWLAKNTLEFAFKVMCFSSLSYISRPNKLLLLFYFFLFIAPLLSASPWPLPFLRFFILLWCWHPASDINPDSTELGSHWKVTISGLTKTSASHKAKPTIVC